MCILIVAPKGTKVKTEALKEASKANPDGAGFAWIEAGKVKTFKSLNQDLVIAKYNSMKIESDMILHFRIKTHGKVELRNIHPFYIRENVVMGHNGTIHKITTHKGMTDSQSFGLKFRRLNYKNPLIQELIEEYIGYSKLAFLDETGYTIIGESKGNWENGIWYSNNSYKPKVIVKQQSYSKWQNNYQREWWEDDYNYWDYSTNQKALPPKDLNLTKAEEDVILHAAWEKLPESVTIYNGDFFVSLSSDEAYSILKNLNKFDIETIQEDFKIQKVTDSVEDLLPPLRIKILNMPIKERVEFLI